MLNLCKYCVFIDICKFTEDGQIVAETSKSFINFITY